MSVELTDKWLRFGNPWEIARSEINFEVKYGGRTGHYTDEQGRYRVPTTNLLRLWNAEAAESFDFEAFNVGDYYAAVDEKVISETISKVLYPNDEPEVGKRLRLAQQYFFVSCLADYQAYVDCQQRVSEAYREQKDWTRMSILNSARVGRFSSDRSIREYCRKIWNVSPITTSEG